MDEGTNNWIKLDPHFGGSAPFREKFGRIAQQWVSRLGALRAEERGSLLGQLRREAQEEAVANGRTDATALHLALSLLSDLMEQGWDLRLDDGSIAARRPDLAADENSTAKEKVRRTLLHERDKQLGETSVRAFVLEMETRQLTTAGWVSIFSLMRDGRGFSDGLRNIAALEDPTEQLRALGRITQPYLQFVSEGERCEHTGLRLVDIWRYFRLTWSIAYKSAPGRRMMILIRDAAVPFHPVMGIAALASGVVQLTCRDNWIGWNYPKFIQEMTKAPSREAGEWILDSLEASIRDIYVGDFLTEGLISKKDIRRPTSKAVTKLLRQAGKAIERHRLYPKAADIKAMHSRHELGGVDWEKLSRSALFRSKRAKTLARLLQSRMSLQDSSFEPTTESLKKALESGPVRRAISVVLREVKAKNVGVGMMDISVCGAVPPYNAVLGGKLVAMLMASPEVVQEYRRRYLKTPSLIASSIRGAAVIRFPRLVLLGTTSLYGSGSSQYNRIRIPAEAVGGSPGESIAYVPLGETLGYGSFHFSKDTLALIESFVARSSQGRRVNSIFGEGVNPRLRKIRQGIDGIGFPEEILRHGSPRLVYMVPLAENFRDVLMGRSTSPRYIVPVNTKKAGTDRIADFWRSRWLAGRIRREGVLEAVAEHALTYPIQHGARVALPQSEEVPTLFDR